MSLINDLQELQSVHDNLRTIQRDLEAFPPDMDQLFKELKHLEKKGEELRKRLQEARTKEGPADRDLAEAHVLETHAKKAVKSATGKVQYTAAIRELDARERQVAAIAKPLQGLRAQIQELETTLGQVESRRQEVQRQFDELHAIFLEEHGNQVQARERLQARLVELEVTLPAGELQRFKRLLTARQGKALATVEGSACMGCRTRLRIPLMTQLKEQGWVICESCQRYLHVPS